MTAPLGWTSVAFIATGFAIAGVFVERQKDAYFSGAEERVAAVAQKTSAANSMHLDSTSEVTIIAALVTLAGVFSLVHYSSASVEKYGWSLLNSVIAIFVSVACYQALDLAVKQYGFAALAAIGSIGFLLDGIASSVDESGWNSLSVFIAMLICIVCFQVLMKETNDEYEFAGHVAMDVIHLVFWLFVTQFAIERANMSKLSLAAVKKALKKDTDGEHTVWCTLFVYLSSFAAIGAGLRIQEHAVFEGLGQIGFLVSYTIALLVLYAIVSEFRSNLSRANAVATVSINREILEAEKEIAAISISFLIFRAIRYRLLDQWEGLSVATNVHGEDSAWFWQCVLCAVCFAFNGFFVHLPHLKSASLSDEPFLFAKLRNFMVPMCAMGTGWCLLAAFTWLVSRIYLKLGLPGTAGPAWQSACVPIVVMPLLVLAIIGLDDLDHEKWMTHHLQLLIESVIKCCALILGFTWERVFDASVASFALASKTPVAVQLSVAAATVIIILPVWQHISKMSLKGPVIGKGKVKK